MQETHDRSLGQEDPLEKGMATHSSILSWEIPWTEEPGEPQSIRLQSQTHLSIWASTQHVLWNWRFLQPLLLFQNCFGYSGTFVFLYDYSGINLSIFAPKKGKKQACLLWDSVRDGLKKLGEADSSDWPWNISSSIYPFTHLTHSPILCPSLWEPLIFVVKSLVWFF